LNDETQLLFTNIQSFIIKSLLANMKLLVKPKFAANKVSFHMKALPTFREL